jgi:predicted RNase H-like HicB family nuclease
METVRVRHHHEADSWWAESPGVEGWSAAGDSYAEVVKLAEEGITFALEHPAELEHFVPRPRLSRGTGASALSRKPQGRIPGGEGR